MSSERPSDDTVPPALHSLRAWHHLSDGAWAAVPALIDVYFDAPNAPAVVHPVVWHRDFVPLRCAMAALGACFRSSRDDQIWGIQLFEYAWQRCLEKVPKVSRCQAMLP